MRSSASAMVDGDGDLGGELEGEVGYGGLCSTRGNNGIRPGGSIAVVDMSADEETLVNTLRQACEDVGFFYLVNHGVEKKLLDDLFGHTRRFFSLPLEEKNKVLQDENNRGYSPLEEETLDPTKQSKGDTKEGYYIGREVSKDDPESSKAFCGPNQWPSEDVIPGWRAVMEKYMCHATRRLLTLLEKTLGLETGFFSQPGRFDAPTTLLRLLHYTEEVSRPDTGVFGAGAHTDYGMFTLLLTDKIPGLQVCRDKEASPQVWEDVLPKEGAYIVNLGDMMQIWTNGRYRSTLHRVVKGGQERYSIPFFFEPNVDCLVECLPQCCSESNPPRYRPTTYGAHLMKLYKATHAGFKPSM